MLKMTRPDIRTCQLVAPHRDRGFWTLVCTKKRGSCLPCLTAQPPASRYSTPPPHGSPAVPPTTPQGAFLLGRAPRTDALRQGPRLPEAQGVLAKETLRVTGMIRVIDE